MRFTLSIVSLIIIGLLTSCSSDMVTGGTTDTGATIDCASVSPTYNNDIRGIMNTSCATPGCHNANTRADGIDLSTFAKVRDEALKARFLGSIRHESGFKRMPEGGSKLADATINTLACWIENGFLE